MDYEPFDDGLAEGWTAFLTKFIVSSAADELAKIASGEDQIPSPVERFVVRRLLDWFRDSDLVEKEHAKHIASPTVSHLLKGTPLVDAADDNKLVFASSYLGRLVARVVKEEGEYLSEWKVAKIVEAAGPQFDAAARAPRILEGGGARRRRRLLVHGLPRGALRRSGSWRSTTRS